MTETNVFSKKEKTILFILFLAVWVYLWLKAVWAPMMHDEIATFFYFVQNKTFVPFFSEWDANNHVLNSALTSVFFTLFGDAPVVLRMPNLLMFPVFFYFSLCLSANISNKTIRWVFILVLCCSIALVDFFAICRGYGMSMAFLMGSIHYLIKVFRDNKFKHQLYCLLLSLLALSANLNLMISFLMVLGLLIFQSILSFQRDIKKNLSLLALYLFLGVVPLLFFIAYMFQLKAHAALYYGSLLGFWKLTVFSLCTMITGMTNWIFPYIFMTLFFIMLFMAAMLSIKKINFKLITQPYLTFFILLCGNMAAILFLGKVMKVNYPEDRVGLYLFPYFIGSVCFLTDKFMAVWNKKWILLVLVPLVFFPVNFVYTLNFSHNNIYLQDRYPKRFFDKVVQQGSSDQYPATIGGNSVKHFCWTFFNYRSGGTQSAMQYWNFPSTDEEYQIARTDEIANWRNYYDSIDYDRSSQLILMKRKTTWHKTLLYSAEIPKADNFNGEFFDISRIKTDSLIGKTLYVGYKLSFQTLAVPFNTRLVIDVSDSAGKGLVYQYISLNWLKLHYTGPGLNLVNGMLVHKLPPEAATLKTYLWNINKIPYSVSGNIFVYEMK